MKYLDKAHHFIWTSWLVFVLYTFGSLHMAIFFALVAAICKEAYDAYQPDNKWDWIDLAFGVMGALFAVFMVGQR